MTVQFKFDFANTPGLTAQHDQLLNELNAAAAEWTKGLKGDGTIVAKVSEITSPDGSTFSDAHFEDTGHVDDQGKEVYVPRAAAEAQGESPTDGFPAMYIDLDLKILAANPDPVSFLAHQIGHGLGFDGWFYNDPAGRTDRDSSYDAHVHNDNGTLTFEGQHAGHVPLSDASAYHLAVPGPDLMNAHEPGTTVTPLDFAVLADIGYQVDPSVLPSG